MLNQRGNRQSVYRVPIVPTAETFDQWFSQFKGLARDEGLRVGDPDEYMEYFDDGDTPSEALAEEMQRMPEDELDN